MYDAIHARAYYVAGRTSKPKLVSNKSKNVKTSGKYNVDKK